MPMPEWTVRNILLVLGVVLLTLAASWTDLRTRRIPNRLTVAAFVLGLVHRAWFDGWAGLADAGQGFALGFGLLFALWLVGGGGGGDVKLLGALSVWLGFRLTLLVLVASTVLVVIGTAGMLIWSVIRGGARRTAERYLATRRPHDDPHRPGRAGRRVMAYALPVALASWLVLAWKLPTLGRPELDRAGAARPTSAPQPEQPADAAREDRLAG